jgi:hypothetical protein
MVWTEITRAKYCRDGLRYASDTTDEEWAMIASYMRCGSHPYQRRQRRRATYAGRKSRPVCEICWSPLQTLMNTTPERGAIRRVTPDLGNGQQRLL